MREMDRVLRLSVEDMDVTVEAGVTRRALEEKLRPEGVFFPVDPGADATLGGMAATGASGTTTVRYGAMRENVLSLTVVTAGGRSCAPARARASRRPATTSRTCSSARRARSGLITELTLRVHPTPEAMSAAVCAFADLTARSTASSRCWRTRSRSRASSCSTRCSSTPSTATPTSTTTSPRRSSSSSTARRRRSPRRRRRPRRSRASTARAASRGPPTRASAAAVAGAPRAPTTRRARCARAPAASRPTPACRSRASPSACSRPSATSPTTGLLAPIVGHVGDGNFHVAILLDPDDRGERERAVAFNERLVQRAIALGGTCTGEHGVGYRQGEVPGARARPRGGRLMRTLKTALDPDGLFNPGKIV